MCAYEPVEDGMLLVKGTRNSGSYVPYMSITFDNYPGLDAKTNQVAFPRHLAVRYLGIDRRRCRL